MGVIAVTGSRFWRDVGTVRRVLVRVADGRGWGVALEDPDFGCRFSPYERIILRHGGCRGLDHIADGVARSFFWRVDPYPVDHGIDGPWPGAGPRRNERMLRAYRAEEIGRWGRDGLPDVLVAFPCPKSRGTWSAVRTAKSLGVPVEICRQALGSSC